MWPYGMAIWPEEHYLTLAPTLEPRAPGYTGKPSPGIFPDMESPLSNVRPLSGRLPKRAKEHQKLALLEVQHPHN